MFQHGSACKQVSEGFDWPRWKPPPEGLVKVHKHHDAHNLRGEQPDGKESLVRLESIRAVIDDTVFRNPVPSYARTLKYYDTHNWVIEFGVFQSYAPV